jgi:hypothetical protein
MTYKMLFVTALCAAAVPAMADEFCTIDAKGNITKCSPNPINESTPSRSIPGLKTFIIHNSDGAISATDFELRRAQELCAGHITEQCLTNPIKPCGYQPDWNAACLEIDRRLGETDDTARAMRKGQEQWELNFVRGVAGMK